MAEKKENWWNDYVGIPYKWQGTNIQEGVSCWGLCVIIQRDIFGKDLSNHFDIEKIVEENPLEGIPDNHIEELRAISLDEVEEGDILHMWGVHNNRKVPLHAGVIIEPGKVLHIEQNAMSVIEDYRKSKRAAWRVIGAYRVAC